MLRPGNNDALQRFGNACVSECHSVTVELMRTEPSFGLLLTHSVPMVHHRCHWQRQLLNFLLLIVWSSGAIDKLFPVCDLRVAGYNEASHFGKYVHY